MSLTTLPVGPYFTAFLYLDITAKTAFGSDTQRLNAQGVPLWTVSVMATSPAGADALKVTVAATLDSLAETIGSLAQAAPVEVVGLRVGAYATKGGRAEFYWAADEVRPKLDGRRS
jgi:hypothetical protein